MRIESRLQPSMGTLVVLIVAGTVIALAVWGRGAGTPPIQPGDFQLPSEDVAALGLELGPAPTEAIAPDAALGIARAEYDPVALGAADVHLYLARVTVPVTDDQDTPIRDRAVWIARHGGMAVPHGGPVTENGVLGAPRVLTTVYIFIDAQSGEFLLAEWQE